MSEELAEVDFQRFWRRLQQLGLNAYESRSYLVLMGHPKFKALELAANQDQRALANALRNRIFLYQYGTPFRQTGGAAPPIKP